MSMTWLLFSALGFAAWVSVLLLLVAICRAAARGDKIAAAPDGAFSGSGSPATSGGYAAVTDLRGFRCRRSGLPRHVAGAARPLASN
jgi:hypothetical protein